MMTSRHRERLPAWITATAVDADDQLHLHSFTRGIRCDHAAVTDGLTLTHSRGPVERQRLPHKTLKRQVHGCPLAWRRHIVRPPPTLRDREHAAFVSQIAG